MFNYYIFTKETTRGLILCEELKVLSPKSVGELEDIFGLNKEYTCDDFVEYYEICEMNTITGELVILKHFDTGFRMDMS